VISEGSQATPPTASTSPPPGLTARQLDRYAEDGFITVRGLFENAEIAELRAEAERLLDREDLMCPQNLRCRFQPHFESGEPLFEVFDPVSDLSPVCARISSDRRILDILEAIYRDVPCLFKDKLIYKLPGARGYDLHQDYPACWPGFPRSFVTVLLAIDAMDAGNGCTEVFAGYHHHPLATEEGGGIRIPEERVAESRRVPLVLAPGDVAFFGCFVPHRSAPNRSRSPRRAYYLSYNAQSDGGSQWSKHYGEFHEYLRKYRRSQGDSADACYFR
jgi:2-aminoethylphosphonate dioxygenase